MKKYIELTFIQLVGLIAGSAAGIIFVALWLNGCLYQYGI